VQTLLRPDVGTQASFRKKKPPHTYRYDSSLSPYLPDFLVRLDAEPGLNLILETKGFDPLEEISRPALGRGG
jgi:hypothetical protein